MGVVTDVIHYVKEGGDGSMVGWMQPPMATACDARAANRGSKGGPPSI
jgi:hypothetical protein